MKQSSDRRDPQPDEDTSPFFRIVTLPLRRSAVLRSAVAAAAFLLTSTGMTAVHGQLPALQKARTVSPLDGATQDILYWIPEAAMEKPAPLFVFLHSWSGDVRQDNSKWLSQAVDREWIWLHPDFRGINQTPKACGSRFARQDVLDAIDWIVQQCQVDPERIYLAGVSGGGHMAMTMAGHHPDRFSAVSAWVGISDLADWHRFHTAGETPTKYARMIEACLGGPPGTSAAVDAEYRDRSAVYFLHQSGDLPVSLWAGVNDGHTGSVPVSHSLRAFNAMATGHGTPLISEPGIQQLVTQRRLAAPANGDEYFDKELDRKVLLRRTTGDSVVTIFDGGHESVPDAACNWLESRRRPAAVAPRQQPSP